jgi:HEAT repeat protein
MPTATPTGTEDPRQTAPDYGSLGPGSDLAAGKPLQPQGGGNKALLAILIGVVLALPFVARDTVDGVSRRVADWLASYRPPSADSPAAFSEQDLEKLDRQPAQKQAELLLQRAVNHHDESNDQIAARVDRWRGHLRFTNTLNSVVTTALNSDDFRVRDTAIEVDLAAYDVRKTPASADHLIAQAASSDRATRIWALWTLGLLANRSVETGRITEVLVTHLHDDDPVSRQWAVEGLALVGTEATIEPLLGAFHDDHSPTVRERAACSLAQSGMLSPELRRTAIPKILTYTDDPALDPATHMWAFHALRDITSQNLPNDPATWRSWYENSR